MRRVRRRIRSPSSLQRRWANEVFRDRVKIYATDVDEEELMAARTASYSDGDIDGLPIELRDRYFDRLGGRWIFANELRRSVIFGRHDLLSDAPISRVDLLLCRNTLMYFHREAQTKIVERFHYALRDGGFLVLGRAEMLVDFADMFAPLDPKQRVFVKLRGETGAERMTAGSGHRDDPMPPEVGQLDAPAGHVVRPGPDGAVRGRCKGAPADDQRAGARSVRHRPRATSGVRCRISRSPTVRQICDRASTRRTRAITS